LEKIFIQSKISTFRMPAPKAGLAALRGNELPVGKSGIFELLVCVVLRYGTRRTLKRQTKTKRNHDGVREEYYAQEPNGLGETLPKHAGILLLTV
jgi:hypothetical protein